MADSSFPAILEPGSSFIARATYVESPHNFYVMPLAHMKHIRSIQKPGRHNRMPKLNDIVVFKSQIHKQYIRGQIQDIDSDNTQCTIFAIDYGSTEECVKFKNIFNVGYEMSDHQPPLAIQCELFMCVPKGETFGDEAKQAFIFYLGDDENLRIRVKAVTDHKLRVEVRNSNPDDVAMMLALTGYTHLAVTTNMGARIKDKKQITWRHRQLKEGDKLSVRLQLAPNFSKLYVSTMIDYKEYLSKHRDFIEYCRYAKDIVEEDFVVGKAVGVKEQLNEPYERAVIIEIIEPGKQAKVRLVDWGREAVVPIDRVKLIQTEMFSKDCVRALYCSAVNSDDFKEFLPQSLCVGYNYRITIKKVGFEFDIPHMVTLA